MPKPRNFRVEGKTNKEVLQNLLLEARDICFKFDQISRRYSAEITEYRIKSTRNTQGRHLDDWVKVSAFKLLFDHAEPEDFDFEFHELRRSFLEVIDRAGPFNDGEIFVSICQISGISPLVSLIVSAQHGLGVLYEINSDPRAIPTLDVFLFEMLELEVVILRLFVDAVQFYGVDQYVVILGG